MPRRVAALFVFLIVLIPSAQFVWKNRKMPQFAYLHDDGVLFVSAKSMAANGYRISSLPENPLQTKFPPLYPLYLSIIWRSNPHFPDNLVLATWLSWMVFVAFVGFVWRYTRREALGEIRMWVL